MSKFPDETMTLNGPEGWTIELDRRELEKEPGEQEPAIVMNADGSLRGTYNAALLYGEVSGVSLSDAVQSFVDRSQADVERFLNI